MRKGWMGTLAVVGLMPTWSIATSAVVESERAIPVSQEVDVVVVGGTCGAVAAAQSAARAGAKVFLAAPRPYLGDDVAGCLRLWLEDDEVPESPLAKSIYVPDIQHQPFTYKTDVSSGGLHKDDSGDMLCDGMSDNVQQHTVEFAGDVEITADLGSEKPVKEVELVTFKRAEDFETDSVRMSVSAEGHSWSAAVPLVAQPTGTPPDMVRYALPLDKTGRYVKVAAKIKPGMKRQLISELILKAKGGGVTVVTPTPLHVKRTFDEALLENGVAYLTGSYATDVLRDAAEGPAGIVIANRSGRQAVVAKVIIDATERAAVARLAGATFAPYPEGPQLFTRVVIAGEAPKGGDVAVRALPGEYNAPVTMVGPYSTQTVPGRMYACDMTIPMNDGSYRSFAEAEQVARDRTFVKSMLEGADTLFQVPPDPMKAVAPLAGAWPGAANVGLDCFRPAGVARLYVLGGCAEMPREAADKLLRPLSLMAVGERVGAAAAAEAKALPQPQGVALRGDAGSAVAAGEVKESLNGPRPFLSGLPTVPAARSALPVLGEYDVVVIGGGTAGAPAGIGAGRQGAKTLVIEYLYGLGGVGTLGMIGNYWYGNRCGFTAEHDQGVKELGAAVHVVGKAEWWRRENRRAGTEIWFGAMGCGALVKDGRITGVVVATPAGRGVVLAKNVIDATGNADIAATAGAPCVFVGADEIAVQGAGLSPRKLGASYNNSDFGYVNDCDAADLWLFGVRGRSGAGKIWDISQLVQSRERRRIVGDCWVTPLDILNGRTFPDTVVQARSDFDSHGYFVADISYVSEPEDSSKTFSANVPYRALLPKGIDGLMVVGIGISAHRDAMPILRMQADVQNMGYAAGVAGATAAREGKTFRTIDVRKLQEHLVKIGNLQPEVPEWKDNAVVSPERLEEAVKNLGSGYKDVSLVLAQWQQALPLMRKAYTSAPTPAERLVYAHVLGIMGDPTGTETLMAAVSGAQPELGLGESAFGRRLSEMDSYIVALGRTKDPRALEPLLNEAAKLNENSPFSRFRAVTLALEALGDSAAAQPLAELLAKPGVSGHAMIGVKAITPAGGYYGAGSKLSLRELAVARALYRCGDYEGAAERVLRTYTHDLRGVYALHATEVLKQKKEERDEQ